MLSLLVTLCAAPLWGQADEVLFQDGFESGLGSWVVTEDDPISTVHPKAAHTGERGLLLNDEYDNAGSSVSTPRFPVDPEMGYRLTFWARSVEGNGAGVYLRFFDQNGRQLRSGSDMQSISGESWREYRLEAYPPEGAVEVEGWVHSYNGATVVVVLDDVVLESFVPQIAPPWESTYKLTPDDPLTAADVPGPDGLVYPDWRMCGIAGGIPAVKTVIGPERFAGMEGKDIAPLINTALDEAAAQGGGAVELPAGEFLLESPVLIQHSGVVLRGAGRDETRLIYQEHIPYGELRARCWTPSGVIGPNGFFEIQANPKDLVLLRATSGDTVIYDRDRSAHWGNRFGMRFRGKDVLEALGPGTHPAKAEIAYANGDTFTEEFEIRVSEEEQPDDLWIDQHGAIMAVGRGPTGPEIKLTATSERGSNQLHLPADHGLKTGDRIMILAPTTDRWNALTGNTCPWGTFRSNYLEVTAVDGGTVTVNQPFRIDFPVEDGTYVQKVGVVENVGVEDLTVEQKVFTTELVGPRIPATLWYPMEDLWANGVTFSHGWNSWVRGVKVVNSGRNPLYLTRSKFCEIRDCIADRAIFRGGGGTGYVGFERSYDCLMDTISTYTMRHAPDLQWGSAGNVVRNGHFVGSDAQWHAGWTHENLFENNVIEQTKDNIGDGTYGHAFFATGPSDSAHGPQGPRNVIYNNDATAPKSGFVMLGGNEAWLILYNRLVLEEGRAVYAKEMSFDHIIAYNTFVLPGSQGPAILIGSANCTGIEIYDNKFYGPVEEVAAFASGLGEFEWVGDNEILPIPAGGAASVPRPEPAVKSIFEWQRSHLEPVATHVSP